MLSKPYSRLLSRLLLVSVGIFLLITLATGKGYGWLSNFSKRKPIIITEQSGNTLTNYQIAINLTYDSDMQPDFSDIRFTWYNATSNEEVEIPYWIEQKIDEDWAYVWVKVPEIPASSTATVYVYYKNTTPVSSESNATATFIVWDDFSSDSISSGYWTVEKGSATVDVTNKYIELGTGSAGTGDTVSHYIGEDLSGFVFKVCEYHLTTGANKDVSQTYINSTSVANTYSFTHTRTYEDDNDGVHWVAEDDKDDTSPYWWESTHPSTIFGDSDGVDRVDVNKWYCYTIKKFPNSTAEASCEGNGYSGTIVRNNHNTTYPDAEIVLHINGGTHRFTNVSLRKYVDPEPTYSMGSEESIYLFTGWLSNFSRRKPIIINEQSGNTLTDYQVAINLTYDSDMQPDFSDVRFAWLRADGKQELIPYWIEEKVDGEWAKIWVKIPEIPANSNTMIYVYYKNTTLVSSESNATEVFDFFDDFSSDPNSNDRWIIFRNAGDTSKECVWDSSGYLKLTTATDDAGCIIFPKLLQGLTTLTGFYARFKIKTSSGSADGMAFAFYKDISQYQTYGKCSKGGSLALDAWDGSNNIQDEGYDVEFDEFQGDGDPSTPHIAVTETFSSGQVTDNTHYGTSNTNYNNGQWHTIEVYFDKSSNHIKVYFDGSNIIDFSGEPFSTYGYPYDWVAFSGATGGLNNEHSIDDILIRRYVDPEPTYSIGAEEEPIFSYRIPINITEQSGNNLSDYQVAINLSYEYGMDWDFSNIRFTNSTSFNYSEWETEYPYWIEKKENGKWAKVWIKIDYLPASSTKTIYVYYGGNIKSSVSSGTAVFDWYEDMESWSGWSNLGSGEVVQSSTYVFEGQYSAKKQTNCDPHGGYKSMGITLDRNNWTLEFRAYRVEGEGTDCYADRLGLEDVGVGGYTFALIHQTDGTDSLGIDVRASDGTGTPYSKDLTVHITDEWYIGQLILTPSQVIAKLYYENGSFIDEYVLSDTSYTSFDDFVIRGGYPYYVDVVRVRKYIDPEPAITLGTVERNSFMFSYRIPINITEQSGNDLTDYQVMLSINTTKLYQEGKIRADCGDLKFTNETSFNFSEWNFEYPYWIEVCNVSGGNSTIWIKVNLTASSTKKIYMYYGSPNATTTSNGDNVFLLFDDFEAESISTEWSITQTGSSSVELSTTYSHGGSQSLKIYDAGDGQAYVQRTDIPTGSIETTVWFREITGQSGTDAQLFFFDDNTNYVATGVNENQYTTTYVYRFGSNWYDSGIQRVDGWHKFTIRWNGSFYKVYIDDTYLATSPSGYGNPTRIFLGSAWSAESSTFYWDDLYTRKITSPEPTYSIGAEETPEPPSVATPKTYNESYSEQTSFHRGNKIIIRVNVTDQNGASDIDKVLIEIIDNSSVIQVANDTMVSVSSITLGFTYEYNYTLPLDAVLGIWTINVYANDTTNYWGYNTTTFEVTDTPPTYCCNSTNSTLAGTAIEHRLKWQDDVGLSGYIFEFCNGTWDGANCVGGWVNDTWVAFTEEMCPNPFKECWSNVTKVVNSTVGATIAWRVYANDTSNQWNASEIYTYVTTWMIQFDAVWSVYPNLIPGETMEIRANITNNTPLDSVWANCSGAWNGNLSMSLLEGKTYYATRISNEVGQINCSINSNDTSGNYNMSDTIAITLIIQPEWQEEKQVETVYLNASDTGNLSYWKNLTLNNTGTIDWWRSLTCETYPNVDEVYVYYPNGTLLDSCTSCNSLTFPASVNAGEVVNYTCKYTWVDALETGALVVAQDKSYQSVAGGDVYEYGELAIYNYADVRAKGVTYDQCPYGANGSYTPIKCGNLGFDIPPYEEVGSIYQTYKWSEYNRIQITELGWEQDFSNTSNLSRQWVIEAVNFTNLEPIDFENVSYTISSPDIAEEGWSGEVVCYNCSGTFNISANSNFSTYVMAYGDWLNETQLPWEQDPGSQSRIDVQYIKSNLSVHNHANIPWENVYFCWDFSNVSFPSGSWSFITQNVCDYFNISANEDMNVSSGRASGDNIDEVFYDWVQDKSKTSNLSTQFISQEIYLVRNTDIPFKNIYWWTSNPNEFGDCDNCSGFVNLTDTSATVYANDSGDVLWETIYPWEQDTLNITEAGGWAYSKQRTYVHNPSSIDFEDVVFNLTCREGWEAVEQYEYYNFSANSYYWIDTRCRAYDIIKKLLWNLTIDAPYILVDSQHYARFNVTLNNTDENVSYSNVLVRYNTMVDDYPSVDFPSSYVYVDISNGSVKNVTINGTCYPVVTVNKSKSKLEELDYVVWEHNSTHRVVSDLANLTKQKEIRYCVNLEREVDYYNNMENLTALSDGKPINYTLGTEELCFIIPEDFEESSWDAGYHWIKYNYTVAREHIIGPVSSITYRKTYLGMPVEQILIYLIVFIIVGGIILYVVISQRKKEIRIEIKPEHIEKFKKLFEELEKK